MNSVSSCVCVWLHELSGAIRGGINKIQINNKKTANVLRVLSTDYAQEMMHTLAWQDVWETVKRRDCQRALCVILKVVLIVMPSSSLDIHYPSTTALPCPALATRQSILPWILLSTHTQTLTKYEASECEIESGTSFFLPEKVKMRKERTEARRGKMMRWVKMKKWKWAGKEKTVAAATSRFFAFSASSSSSSSSTTSHVVRWCSNKSAPKRKKRRKGTGKETFLKRQLDNRNAAPTTPAEITRESIKASQAKEGRRRRGWRPTNEQTNGKDLTTTSTNQ